MTLASATVQIMITKQASGSAKIDLLTANLGEAFRAVVRAKDDLGYHLPIDAIRRLCSN